MPGALIVVVAAIAALLGVRLREPRHRDRRPGRGRPAPPDASRPRRSPTSSRSLPAALGLFLVSFADEILTARAFAGKRGEHVRASQELLTMGAANAAAGFTQAFSIGASGARTAVNDAMGARTQIAGLFAAGHGRRRSCSS